MASDDLKFKQGEIGFLFAETSDFGHPPLGKVYAFSTIEEAAAWLVNRYAPARSTEDDDL